MSRTRGEGRASAEKAGSLVSTPEARRARRAGRQAEQEEWAAKNGPVVVRRTVKIIYVDGACTLTGRTNGGGHCGPGGWAWVRLNDDGTVFSSKAGSEPNTTNQRMELAAALAALRDHHRGDIEIVSDSAYLVNCFLQQWYVGWHKRKWISSSGKPVQNRDLWEAIFHEVDHHEGRITWRHVRGHIGDPGNEAADQLAVEAKLGLMG